MEKIDKLDRMILNIAMKNARIPSKEIAERCGVSRAAIHQRIQRLIENRVITGSCYLIDPSKLGYNTCTYVGVKLDKPSLYREAARQMADIPEVVECHFTTGPYTMLIKVYAYDNHHLMDLLNSRIQLIPGVKETETFISLDTACDRQIQLSESEEPHSRRRRPSSPSDPV